MRVTVNLKRLENKHIRLQGEIPFEELDLEGVDELVHLHQPLVYNFEVQKSAGNLLLHGDLKIILRCECARCLKPHDQGLALDPWVCHVPLEGEEAAPVINDCVDLTPYIREDIVLAFPQHPLCSADCQGPEELRRAHAAGTDGDGSAGSSGSPWSELDKLQF